MNLKEKIFLLTAIISAFPVFIIIVRKFSVLSVLNTDNIPGEKEANFKKEIIKKRVDRDLLRFISFFTKTGDWIKKSGAGYLSFFENNLKSLKSFYLKNKILSAQEKKQKIKELFKEIELVEKDDESLVESKLLEIINLDEKNSEAFFALGHLYFDLDKLNESIQTFSHALKLLIKEKKEGIRSSNISVSEVYFSLAEVAQKMERLDNALDYIKEALDLEPNNPRFLDLILDLSIIKKDKELARIYYDKMSLINPENKKLLDWEKDINDLE